MTEGRGRAYIFSVTCPLTHLPCLKACGGPHGNRCASAPTHDSPAAIADFSDPRIAATYAAQTLAGPGALTLALAQLTELGAVSPGRLNASFIQTPAGNYLSRLPAMPPSQEPPPPPPPPPLPVRYVTAAQYATEHGVPLVERIFRGQILFTLLDGRQMGFGAGKQPVPANLADHPWLLERQISPNHIPMYANPPPEEPVVLERTVGVAELIGWRIWAVTASDMLKSFAKPNVWLPDKPMTGKPRDDGMEGVWAFKDRKRATAKAVEHRYERNIKGYAWGAVALWGDVIEHEHGWRAENARVISLDGVVLPVPKQSSKATLRKPHRILSTLRRKYGVANFAKAKWVQAPDFADDD